MANVISSDLQLTKVLNSSLRAFKRAILPLTAFSTVFERQQLQGTDTIAVPYYPLASSASQTRAASGSYLALATDTATGSKSITPTRHKMQAISFTSTERSRQPALNPEMHGQLKGEKLAYDVLADVLSVIRLADYTGTTLAAGDHSSFDEDDVADLARICMSDYWPEVGRSLILDPSFYFNLVKQPAIIDASQSGSVAALREAAIRRLLTFDVFGSAGTPTNNGTAVTGITGVDSTDVITATAHGLAVGDRVRFPALTGGSALTADTGRYYVKTVPTADTLTIAATAGGATQTLGSNITDGSIQKYENLGGFACFPSAILTAFAPVEPSGAMRQQLADYRIVEDDESDLVLEYKHLVYPDTDQEVQVIECHYGYALGETAALKPIVIS